MRIAIMGTGAVGGYFGAKLAAAGHRVAFIARGTHLDAMRCEGLKVKSPGGNLHIRHSLFTSEPAAAGIVDLVLFCVKSYDTETCAKSLAPLMGRETLVLSLQNGVDNIDLIAELWGAQRALAGVVYLGAKIAAPGVIHHSAAGRIVFGQLDDGSRESTAAAQKAFASANIPCELETNIRRTQWAKLLWNAAFCAIACLTRTTVKEIVESESLTKLAVDCMNEVRAAARTRGIGLAAGVINDTLSFSKSLGDFKPSMLQDLESGKPLECEAFNGIVVKTLQQAGKQAPTNQIFYGALKYLDKRIREQGKC
ncbi:MAG: ketopantoate reductase family protein [Candidatus Binatia bacterium]